MTLTQVPEAMVLTQVQRQFQFFAGQVEGDSSPEETKDA